MKKTPDQEYLEKVTLLTEDETERLLSRMRGKLMRRLEDKKLSVLEVAAIQLEIEDGVDFPRFCRHISTSSLKLLKRPRAQLVEVTVPADSIVEPLDVIKHI